MRLLLLAALVPFVVATVAGLVVLWPTHHKLAIPLQYQTYGEGKTVFEKGKVVEVISRTCGGPAGSISGQLSGGSSGSGSSTSGSSSSGGAATAGSTTICSTAKVALTSGPDKGRVVSLDTGGVADVKLAGQ